MIFFQRVVWTKCLVLFPITQRTLFKLLMFVTQFLLYGKEQTNYVILQYLILITHHQHHLLQLLVVGLKEQLFLVKV
ncbi:MAG: hypothetical protein EBY80_10320 [Actinobacteria bacterium]|nr:hypothetical protein [Actinomycetota bacterium]NDA77469.1 hypothetical protein [Actinomycetota bacterium]